MSDCDKNRNDIPEHYKRRIKQLLYEYNRPFPGPYYFARLLRGKNKVKIADLGSGPVCTLGNIWGNVEISIIASDLRAEAYLKLIQPFGVKLITPLEYQDMENLTYEDESFDVVHCVNALDHTPNAKAALCEMQRICKVGGYIYLRHAHNQKTAHKGRGHFWDIKAEGITNGIETIKLEKGWKTIDDGDFVISIYHKEKSVNF
ncbi:MAG: class I SAM-dependent methyltransferase [Patescibacteria group bacterium]|nr:class I SAM-dependent methyltransferase [Patescibacteria group bacterium]